MPGWRLSLLPTVLRLVCGQTLLVNFGGGVHAGSQLVGTGFAMRLVTV